MDEIPFDEQRRMPVSEGGRGHILIRRSFKEYKDAFDYAHFVISRVRINRTIELRYLQAYKNRMREEKNKKRLQTFVFKSRHELPVAINESIASSSDLSDKSNESRASMSSKIKSFYQKHVRRTSATTDETESLRPKTVSEEAFEKYKDCTICLEAFKNGDKVKLMPMCGHIFHEQCCVHWLEFKFSCPNCNLPIEFKKR